MGRGGRSNDRCGVRHDDKDQGRITRCPGCPHQINGGQERCRSSSGLAFHELRVTAARRLTWICMIVLGPEKKGVRDGAG